MDITEVTVMHHAALVLVALWAAASAGWAHPAFFLVALVYLFKVNERYTMRLRRRLQCEERKCANQRRLLSDAETVRWLNYAVEKIWPVCMERVASQQFLLPIIPWFLDKFKPWTVVLVGVRFLRQWPFIGRVRVCFVEPPYFQMTMKPLFGHGLDVTELPGISG